MVGDFCLRKTVPVGAKSDPICPNTILLRPDKQLTFGRIPIPGETNVRLQSKIAPLMISRKHATVSCSDGKWCLNDHESLNGVLVNGTRIQGNTPHELHIGDKIVFGVALESCLPEFEYIFDVMSVKKRAAETRPSCSKDPKQRKVLSESGPNVSSSSKNDCQTEDKLKAAEERIKILEASLGEREKSLESVISENNSTKQKADLGLKERLEIEKNLTEQLKAFEKKETILSKELANQKAMLIFEKEKVEERLQQELNQKLDLKDLELQAKLENEKAKLENVIAEKETQQMDLLSELTQYKQEVDEYKDAIERLKAVEANEKKLETNLEELKCLVEQKEVELKQQQEVTKKAQEVAQTVVEEMEDEFSCIVCQELFIRATTLACSHSFCEYCLYSWLKKRNSCPVCRCVVETQPIHSLVLDNAISKMVESMDDESNRRRKSMLQERADKSRDLVFPIAQVQVHRTDNERSYNDATRYDRSHESREPRRIPIRGYHANRYDEILNVGTNFNERNSNYNYQQHAQRNPYYRAGYGYNVVCYACGVRGHMARACPYSQR